MCHLRQRLRTFLFCRKTMFGSQYIQSFWFLTIPWFTKSVMPRSVISTWDKMHFWISFEHGSLHHQTWLIDRWKANNIQESFEHGGLGLSCKSFFNLATCSNYSITSYVPVFHFFFFEKVYKGHLKMLNDNY